MTLLTDPSFLSAVTAAFVTGVFGPLVLQYFKLKFRKKSDPLHQELKLSNIINEKLLEVQEEQFTVNVEMLINCINHNNALDLHHQLLSYIPVGKFMHFYEFMFVLRQDKC